MHVLCICYVYAMHVLCVCDACAMRVLCVSYDMQRMLTYIYSLRNAAVQTC